MLVVDKRAGLLTHSTPRGKGENLLDLLRRFVGPRSPVLPVHRLDRDVSGLLVFARTPEARQRLIEQFRVHEVERRYRGVVQGLVPSDEGTFESRLRTDATDLRVYSDEGEEGEGRQAITQYRVVRRLAKPKATLVEITLETGIRNQIRVHFAEAGFPLLGDAKYRDAKGGRGGGKHAPSRIFLHAAILGFLHPKTGAPQRFESPLPRDLARWLERLSGGARERF